MGVAKNLELAHAWYRRAAAFGVPEAQYNLGYLLLNGDGVPPSPEQAARWFGEAARNGFGPAQLALGYLYLEGAGVAKDTADAWAWFRAAESRKTDGAADAREKTGAALSPAELRRAENLAAPRLKK
jgi:TPR repeat protein